ncbi:hypothetical protein OnM2_017075 [Erysiphe neolycopersici]|uniref:Uncharacterized protein n=1 Tax=Erysiphe neolycopersici TaxID=212602 RepID=A0A420I4Q5_9PEZI|nr:hypothetical protein OnM2_017075 [Erysiphe neolycopersici]
MGKTETPTLRRIVHEANSIMPLNEVPLSPQNISRFLKQMKEKIYARRTKPTEALRRAASTEEIIRLHFANLAVARSKRGSLNGESITVTKQAVELIPEIGVVLFDTTYQSISFLGH